MLGRFPEGGGLDLVVVSDHQELQLGERVDDLGRVRADAHRVETEGDEAFRARLGAARPHRAPPIHVVVDVHPGVVAVDLRQPLVPEVVLLGRRIAVERLEETDHELGIVRIVVHARPRFVVQRGWRHQLEVRLQVGVPAVGSGEVAGQVVEDPGDIGRALDVGVAAHRVYPATRPPDVPQKELQGGGGPDHLHADRVLRPPERIHDGADPLRVPGRGDDLRHLEELIRGRAADPLHHLRRVAVDVLLEQLQGAARVLHGGVHLVPVRLRIGVVSPRRLVVLLARLVESREEAVFEAELLADDVRAGGMDPDVLLVVAAGVQGVPDDAVQERDVGSRPDLRVDVSDGRGAGEAGIDHHQLGVAVPLRFHRPLESAGVVLGGVAAHHQDDIGIPDVDPVVGHRTASERGGQTGHRGAVSNPGLTVAVRDSQRFD